MFCVGKIRFLGVIIRVSTYAGERSPLAPSRNNEVMYSLTFTFTFTVRHSQYLQLRWQLYHFNIVFPDLKILFFALIQPKLSCQVRYCLPTDTLACNYLSHSFHCKSRKDISCSIHDYYVAFLHLAASVLYRPF